MGAARAVNASLAGSSHPDVLIIGGGILGCSIAWHYARLGIGQVMLLERHALAASATSQAAALLTQARAKTALMPLIAQTYADIAVLEAELGESLDLRRVGSLHVAATEARQRELSELALIANSAGLQVESWTVDEIRRRVPWLNSEAVAAATFMPDDGFIDPYRLALAYARAARRQGAGLRQNTAVQRLERQGNRIVGVRTAQEVISAGCVIDSAGIWANLLATSVAITLPLAPVRSHYWITAPDPLFPRHHPIVILPDARAYSRPELGGLLFGLREPQSVSYDPRQLPSDLSGFALSQESGWSSLIEGAPALRRFLPMLDRLEIAHYVAGLCAYTPDGLFVLGGIAGIDGFLAATGCSGGGIAAAGGIGASIAALAAGRRSPFDLTPFRPDRFGTIDPFSQAFRQRCEAARSAKVSG